MKLHAMHETSPDIGDAKSENIFATSDSHKLSLLDFNGGNTLPYVSRHLAGTKDGDLHGLERIVSFIDNIDVKS